MSDDHPKNWSPGRRIHYKMWRLNTPTFGRWADEPNKDAFESVGAESPDSVPTVDEIIERDLEIGIKWP